MILSFVCRTLNQSCSVVPRSILGLFITHLMVGGLAVLVGCGEEGSQLGDSSVQSNFNTAWTSESDKLDGVVSDQKEPQSREYKMILKRELFEKSSASEQVERWWWTINDLIFSELRLPTDGLLGGEPRIRTVQFLDVPGSCALYKNGMVFRERVEGDEREVTFKVRSVDRLWVYHQQVSSEFGEGKSKFEEDITPPFGSKYSRSVTAVIDDDIQFERVLDIKRNFTEVTPLSILNGSSPLAVVGDQHIYEMGFKGATIDLGGIKAQMSIALWFTDADPIHPAVAEASFKIEDKRGYYSSEQVRLSHELFKLMHSLKDWTATEGVTKTAFVYGLNPEFCVH